jgi:hypothetical protein
VLHGVPVEPARAAAGGRGPGRCRGCQAARAAE